MNCYKNTLFMILKHIVIKNVIFVFISLIKLIVDFLIEGKFANHLI